MEAYNEVYIAVTVRRVSRMSLWCAYFHTPGREFSVSSVNSR